MLLVAYVVEFFIQICNGFIVGLLFLVKSVGAVILLAFLSSAISTVITSVESMFFLMLNPTFNKKLYALFTTITFLIVTTFAMLILFNGIEVEKIAPFSFRSYKFMPYALVSLMTIGLSFKDINHAKFYKIYLLLFFKNFIPAIFYTYLIFAYSQIWPTVNVYLENIGFIVILLALPVMFLILLTKIMLKNNPPETGLHK